jgi:type IV pilus assembly protein PilA
MNKNKGFTLIELLAVIVILAILMVIAVPKILNVIENSRKSAVESSIKLVKDAIKTQVTSESMMGTNFTSDKSGCYIFNFDDQTSGNAKELQLKNKENITGTIKYCNGNFTNNTLVFDGQDMKTIVCKGAKKETLHTEKCEQTDSTYYCSGAGFAGKTITYGTVPEKELKSGDAFDCDVNGDGTYDENTERFYYVTDKDDNTAVLIYYNNVSKGQPSKNATYAYDTSKENWHGPRTAIEQLPSTSEWRNVSLTSSVRNIVTENGTKITTGGTLPDSFSYAGKAARLLTIQEVRKATGISNIPTWKVGELDNFNYLLENTKYSNGSNAVWSWWLENPGSSDNAWNVSGRSRYVHSDGTVSYAGGFGVRPVIEVPKSNIEY